ncbi:FHA domain-containing protein [Streptomyces sp. MUM 203J]|uniref:FHA domain-containing protein n=1 Tax=Streptomyces sp. MUM 203J TaxID=2791990 RepID=UPI001F038977|nr:FHA domain-containing protein [Streptomyces sp. MUM 203J]MCH0539266.1 FHA domain-containing protein [Streptomyces sp. MUM 203J]
MPPRLVGHQGSLAGQQFPIGTTPTTLGRNGENSVVISGGNVSRFHAEVRREGHGFVLYDRGSSNGTRVNGTRVTSHELQPGDLIAIGSETFRFEAADAMETILDFSVLRPLGTSGTAPAAGPVLSVTVSGGGPVGLSLALLLEDLMGDRVAITVYDGRWTQDGARVVWKSEGQGNVRRQQVVTVQSRQYLHLPQEVQERLFRGDAYSEMWPVGPDSIRGCNPRNLRIAYIEDTLLELANEKPGRIRLVPAAFEPEEQQENVAKEHVLAICEGGRSRTREHFADKFGSADKSIYSLHGRHVQDVVLGLRVKSSLTDPMTVLLTVAQNRFLLNSLRGRGFLNMRLTDEEATEVIGIDPVRHVFEECIASRPCVMGRDGHGDFQCATHSTLFLPAMVRGSALWKRVLEGLTLFGVPEQELSAVTAFRLDMVQRPRFTTRLHSATPDTPGTYGFLLGDAANAIHFWPGRGLNSGLGSAISLARSLNGAWKGRPFRDADFARHEAAMSMLQYRHKSRAWNAMITTDEGGVSRPIKEKIAQSIEESEARASEGREPDRNADLDAFMERLRGVRDRLAPRVPGMPDDQTLRDHLETLRSDTLRTLLDSGPWDTLIVGGEEVDIDIFYRPDSPSASGPAETTRAAS